MSFGDQQQLCSSCLSSCVDQRLRAVFHAEYDEIVSTTWASGEVATTLHVFWVREQPVLQEHMLFLQHVYASERQTISQVAYYRPINFVSIYGR